MQPNLDKLHFLIGDLKGLEQIQHIKVLPIFSTRIISFLAALSKQLLADKRSKDYPDIVSYAFWIRRSALEKSKDNYPQCDRKIGRGVTFHIAPANVPVNFAVSMTSALLAGNACIIRVSNKTFEQVAIICEAIEQLLASEYYWMKEYLYIIRYDHQLEITQYLSELCDVRVVWGGNETINKIREAKLPPRAIELTFGDRYSIAIINGDKYLNCDAKVIADKFYTDTYYSDQNACSSPRIIIWTGKQVQKAQELFWRTLEEKVKREYVMEPIQVVNKLATFSKLVAQHQGVHLVEKNNWIMRIKIDRLFDELMHYKQNSGYFFEYITEDLRELTILFRKECQTVACLGIEPEEIKKLVVNSGVKGVDRIVPIGDTMMLSFIWDGYDMIDTMSRYLSV